MENLFNNGNVFKYGKSNKEDGTEMFIQSIYVTIMKNPIVMYLLREFLNQSKKICRFWQGNGKEWV